MTSVLSDAELVERARRGELDTDEELVRRYQGVVIRVAGVSPVISRMPRMPSKSAHRGVLVAGPSPAPNRFGPGCCALLPMKPDEQRTVLLHALDKLREEDRI